MLGDLRKCIDCLARPANRLAHVTKAHFRGDEAKLPGGRIPGVGDIGLIDLLGGEIVVEYCLAIFLLRPTAVFERLKLNLARMVF
ncbi:MULTISPECIES: hypothetical protein [Pseudomonas]|uniref:Uncharacterized protein n=1 Tax=Pseudomonas mosselii TaxID=78327 RepID=A0A5R8YXY3_9PSED|nr:hypothetical protein [Pseudomonas mosselii]TLP58293.1 hypothetical protein FEM01_16575 [Pseudomonas mosselii]